ncbi:MAG: hypothetical protein BWY72_01860 [Bacteroidetes bacterium ADurb.Bin416]|nr:MAG: hypothetical protein BWY72_01860 [Bacteroidetes bacterium ADurb.Bin416]
MVFIAVGRLGLTIHVITKGRVIFVTQGLFLPLRDGQVIVVITLVVPLGRTKTGKRQRMIVEHLGQIDKPGIGLEIGPLYVTVTGGLGAQESGCPAIFTQACRERNALFQVAIVA